MPKLIACPLSGMLAAVTLAFVPAMASPAVAQTYPWCADTANAGGATNCGFSTFEQCLAAVRGTGGYCRENADYHEPAPAAATSGKKKSKKRQ
jgi:hypothetical protein